MKKEQTNKNAEDDGAEKRVEDVAEAVAESEACACETCEKEAESSAEEKKPTEEQVLRDKLLRLHADFDNYRKRVARDHSDIVKQSNADLIESLLPVLDHIGHAEAMMEKSAGEDAAPYLEGFRMVKNELIKALDGYGLKPIDVMGAKFDANIHEALSAMPSETVAPGEILFEVRRGYTLNGRVLRAAQVIVSADDVEEASPQEIQVEEPSPQEMLDEEVASEEAGE